ncbi:unnamed protein product [Amoebophrya sp. A120]|nr:unnamed protein product [Amoebophrya sp. A120]|eukprot:GSA120T00014447001.1
MGIKKPAKKAGGKKNLPGQKRDAPADFKKVKQKVGKAKKHATNATRTDFRAKKIQMPTQAGLQKDHEASRQLFSGGGGGRTPMNNSSTGRNKKSSSTQHFLEQNGKNNDPQPHKNFFDPNLLRVNIEQEFFQNLTHTNAKLRETAVAQLRQFVQQLLKQIHLVQQQQLQLQQGRDSTIPGDHRMLNDRGGASRSSTTGDINLALAARQYVISQMNVLLSIKILRLVTDLSLAVRKEVLKYLEAVLAVVQSGRGLTSSSTSSSPVNCSSSSRGPFDALTPYFPLLRVQLKSALSHVDSSVKLTGLYLVKLFATFFLMPMKQGGVVLVENNGGKLLDRTGGENDAGHEFFFSKSSASGATTGAGGFGTSSYFSGMINMHGEEEGCKEKNFSPANKMNAASTLTFHELLVELLHSNFLSAQTSTNANTNLDPGMVRSGLALENLWYLLMHGSSGRGGRRGGPRKYEAKIEQLLDERAAGCGRTTAEVVVDYTSTSQQQALSLAEMMLVSTGSPAGGAPSVLPKVVVDDPAKKKMMVKIAANHSHASAKHQTHGGGAAAGAATRTTCSSRRTSTSFQQQQVRERVENIIRVWRLSKVCKNNTSATASTGNTAMNTVDIATITSHLERRLYCVSLLEVMLRGGGGGGGSGHYDQGNNVDDGRMEEDFCGNNSTSNNDVNHELQLIQEVVLPQLKHIYDEFPLTASEFGSAGFGRGGQGALAHATSALLPAVNLKIAKLFLQLRRTNIFKRDHLRPGMMQMKQANYSSTMEKKVVAFLLHFVQKTLCGGGFWKMKMLGSCTTTSLSTFGTSNGTQGQHLSRMNNHAAVQTVVDSYEKKLDYFLHEILPLLNGVGSGDVEGLGVLTAPVEGVGSSSSKMLPPPLELDVLCLSKLMTLSSEEQLQLKSADAIPLRLRKCVPVFLLGGRGTMMNKDVELLHATDSTKSSADQHATTTSQSLYYLRKKLLVVPDQQVQRSGKSSEDEDHDVVDQDAVNTISDLGQHIDIARENYKPNSHAAARQAQAAAEVKTWLSLWAKMLFFLRQDHAGGRHAEFLLSTTTSDKMLVQQRPDAAGANINIISGTTTTMQELRRSAENQLLIEQIFTLFRFLSTTTSNAFDINVQKQLLLFFFGSAAIISSCHAGRASNGMKVQEHLQPVSPFLNLAEGGTMDAAHLQELAVALLENFDCGGNRNNSSILTRKTSAGPGQVPEPVSSTSQDEISLFSKEKVIEKFTNLLLSRRRAGPQEGGEASTPKWKTLLVQILMRKITDPGLFFRFVMSLVCSEGGDQINQDNLEDNYTSDDSSESTSSDGGEEEPRIIGDKNRGDKIADEDVHMLVESENCEADEQRQGSSGTTSTKDYKNPALQFLLDLVTTTTKNDSNRKNNGTNLNSPRTHFFHPIIAETLLFHPEVTSKFLSERLKTSLSMLHLLPGGKMKTRIRKRKMLIRNKIGAGTSSTRRAALVSKKSCRKNRKKVNITTSGGSASFPSAGTSTDQHPGKRNPFVADKEDNAAGTTTAAASCSSQQGQQHRGSSSALLPTSHYPLRYIETPAGMREQQEHDGHQNLHPEGAPEKEDAEKVMEMLQTTPGKGNKTNMVKKLKRGSTSPPEQDAAGKNCIEGEKHKQVEGESQNVEKSMTTVDFQSPEQEVVKREMLNIANKKHSVDTSSAALLSEKDHMQHDQVFIGLQAQKLLQHVLEPFVLAIPGKELFYEGATGETKFDGEQGIVGNQNHADVEVEVEKMRRQLLRKKATKKWIRLVFFVRHCYELLGLSGQELAKNERLMHHLVALKPE